MLGFCMTQIDGQMGQVYVDIHSPTVPVEHAAHCKAVTQTPQVWPMLMRPSADAEAANNSEEGAANRTVGERSARFGNKERIAKTVIT